MLVSGQLAPKATRTFDQLVPTSNRTFISSHLYIHLFLYLFAKSIQSFLLPKTFVLNSEVSTRTKVKFRNCQTMHLGQHDRTEDLYTIRIPVVETRHLCKAATDQMSPPEDSSISSAGTVLSRARTLAERYEC